MSHFKSRPFCQFHGFHVLTLGPLLGPFSLAVFYRSSLPLMTSSRSPRSGPGRRRRPRPTRSTWDPRSRPKTQWTHTGRDAIHFSSGKVRVAKRHKAKRAKRAKVAFKSDNRFSWGRPYSPTYCRKQGNLNNTALEWKAKFDKIRVGASFFGVHFLMDGIKSLTLFLFHMILLFISGPFKIFHGQIYLFLTEQHPFENTLPFAILTKLTKKKDPVLVQSDIFSFSLELSV